MDADKNVIDRIQRLIAKAIATNAAGIRLLLIGGFRFRLLDGSQRFSADIDYHWGDDLREKQLELLQLSQRVIVDEVRRSFGYMGSAALRTGPDSESPNAKLVDLRFWQKDRIVEIPIEVTVIPCFDPPIVRTAQGIIHATASDADLIESKVLAILNRVFLQHRDLLDLFLFAGNLTPDSPKRLAKKLNKLSLDHQTIRERLKDLEEHGEYHARAIQTIISQQMEAVAAQQLQAGGGGKAVLEGTLELLRKNVIA